MTHSQAVVIAPKVALIVDFGDLELVFLSAVTH